MKNVILWVVAVAVGVAALWWGIGYRERIESTPVTPPADAPPAPTSSQPTSTPSMSNNLKIEDIKVGTGAEAVAGRRVAVHYTGTLENGTKFDSSRDRGTAFAFTLGAGDVIPGWDQGVAGMKIGGVRRLTIPPELAYGATGQGPIPPNATLIFEIELVGVDTR